MNVTTQADTTQGIANADAQLTFDLASSAANDLYQVTLANLQQAFENGAAAQFTSTLANLFAPGVSAMGDFAVALAAAAQSKQAAVQPGLRNYKVAASHAEMSANDAINTAVRDKTVAALDNEQVFQTSQAELNRDAVIAKGQSAMDAAATGHLQTAVPIAPTPGALSISQLTERVIINYWATVPFVQASLVSDMYNRGPQQYYTLDGWGNNALWLTEWQAWRNTGEQLRAGLVLERRPVDPLNSQLNDYNPYRTAGEFKPREDWEVIVADRAHPQEIDQVLQFSFYGVWTQPENGNWTWDYSLAEIANSLTYLGVTVTKFALTSLPRSEGTIDSESSDVGELSPVSAPAGNGGDEKLVSSWLLNSLKKMTVELAIQVEGVGEVRVPGIRLGEDEKFFQWLPVGDQAILLTAYFGGLPEDVESIAAYLSGGGDLPPEFVDTAKPWDLANLGREYAPVIPSLYYTPATQEQWDFMVSLAKKSIETNKSQQELEIIREKERRELESQLAEMEKASAMEEELSKLLREAMSNLQSGIDEKLFEEVTKGAELIRTYTAHVN